MTSAQVAAAREAAAVQVAAYLGGQAQALALSTPTPSKLGPPNMLYDDTTAAIVSKVLADSPPLPELAADLDPTNRKWFEHVARRDSITVQQALDDARAAEAQRSAALTADKAASDIAQSITDAMRARR